jgi:hypothetical protein
VKKQNKKPMKPEKFILKATPTQPIRGLRETETANNYLWFCEHFMECVISSADWKLKSRNKRLSEYVTYSLEAFAVLMYYNAFPVWNQRWTVDTVNSVGTTSTTVEGSDDDDISTLSGVTPKKGFMFTGESKGARKYEGWNNEGMVFYNDLLALVEKQRGHPGCTFEHDLLVALSKKKRKGRGIDTENQPPRVRNQVDELMRIVGV